MPTVEGAKNAARSAAPTAALPDNPAAKPRAARASRLLLALLVIVAGVGVAQLVAARFAAPPQKPVASVLLPNVPALQELSAFVRQKPKDRELQLTLAQSYLHYGHYLSAREHFSQALKLGADEWTVLSGRAQAEIKLDRTDLAAKDLERLIQLRPGRVETYLTLAEQLQHADDWKAAHAVLDRVPLEADGLPRAEGTAEARVVAAELLATAYSHIDDWKRAGELTDSALAAAPTRLSARILRGKVLHATGKRAGSVPVFEEAVAAAPESAELHYLLGTAYQARNKPGDLDRTFEQLKQAVGLDGKHGPATLALAKEFDRRGNKKLAAFGYNKANGLGMEGGQPLLRSGDLLLQTGNQEEGWYRRGLYFEATGRPDLAVKEYENLTRLHDCCRSGYMHLARAYGGMHQPAKVLSYLRKARAIEPARAKELTWSLIQALGDSKYEKERVKLLNDLVAAGGPDGEEACYQLAVTADSSGNYAEAMQWLERCLKSNPKDPVYHAELGKLMLQQRADPEKLKGAISHLETTIRLAPDNYDAFYYLGLAYSYSNRLDDAVIALRHSVDLQPENGEGYQTLARVLNQAGRKEEASDVLTVFRRYEEFKESRDILAARCKREPNNAEAQRRMAEFHMQAHEYPAAVERYKKSLSIRPSDRQSRARLAEALGYLGRREEQRAQTAILAKPAPQMDARAPQGGRSAE